MFDAKRLLDSLVQAGMTGSTGRRVQNALGAQGLGGQAGSGGLLDQIGRMLGAAQGGAGGLGDLLGQAMGGLQQSAGRAGEAIKSNDPLTVGGLGAVVGALLAGRKGAVGGGALALLGSLAYSALKGVGQAQAAAAAPPAAELEQLTSDDTAMLLIRAMITAAKADGQIDRDEIDRIASKLAEIGADAEAQRWVMAEMQAPADVAGLVAQVRGPAVAAEVYAASLLAIEVDTPAEQAYLADLARRLQLPPEAVAQIHRALGLA